MYIHVCIYIYIYIHTYLHIPYAVPISSMPYSVWRWGVTCLFNYVSHDTPDVTPRDTSSPMPFLSYKSRAKHLM